MRFYAGLALVACALATGTAAAEPAQPPRKGLAAPTYDRWELRPAPPSGDLRARVTWAGKEADALHALAARSPRNQRPGLLLAALAVVVSADLERSISVGDLANATALRDLFEKKLGDAQVRLGRIAQHGMGGADFALGVLALHGILASRDRDEACRHFESAWAAGFRLPAYRLSDCVAATDPVRAEALLRRAADSGDAAAAEMIGRGCMESTPRDLACAAAHIASAAGAGRPSAKSLLGWMYAQGAGVPVTPARALALYTEAAGAGDLSAKNNLGELHETGRGVSADPARAVGYYREAAEAGFAPAQFNLGRMYASGSGVAADPEKAKVWLRAALKGGIAPAQQVLDWLDTRAAGAKP